MFISRDESRGKILTCRAVVEFLPQSDYWKMDFCTSLLWLSGLNSMSSVNLEQPQLRFLTALAVFWIWPFFVREIVLYYKSIHVRLASHTPFIMAFRKVWRAVVLRHFCKCLLSCDGEEEALGAPFSSAPILCCLFDLKF